MALVVEDGSGSNPAANSYVSVADADLYFVDRNSAAWAALTTASKTAALLYAASWLDTRYSWPGVISDADQPMAWPRDGATDVDLRPIAVDEIPRVLIDAQCEAALASSVEALNEVRARGGKIDSVGVGTISVSFSSSAPPGRTFPYIDGLLSRIASPFASGIIPTFR